MRSWTARLSLLLLAGAVALVAAAPASAARLVQLRPAAGTPGSTFVVKGSGFPRNRRVQVGIRGSATRTPRASRSGTFELKVKAPNRLGGLPIVSRARGVGVVNRFQVVTALAGGGVLEAATTGGRRVRVTPARMLPGARVAVHGTGFGSRRSLRVSIYGRKTTVRSARNGVFDAALTLPRAIAVGYSKLAVTGKDTRIVFRVYRSPAAVSPPSTGGSPTTPTTPGITPTPEPGATPTPAPPGPAVAPANRNRPRIVSGLPRPGQTLISDTGNWSGTTPLTFGHQWLRCDDDGNDCADIAGATTSAYVVAGADVGSALRVAVTATNAAGSATSRSNPTTPAGDPPQNTAPPSVPPGPPIEGLSITADPGGWTGLPAPTFQYRWYSLLDPGVVRDTGLTYTPNMDDVNGRLLFEVVASNVAGNTTRQVLTEVVLASP